MRPLTASELLDLWENCREQSSIQKSLQLLSVACSITSISVAARLSIGERDSRLLQLREWMFGTHLVNRAVCPDCCEQVEWEMDLNDLRLQRLSPELSVKVLELQKDGYHIRFRLPNSQDIATAISNSEYHSNPKKLLSDCILDVQYDEKELANSDLPDDVFEAIHQHMAMEDPQADITMMLSCHQCANEWKAHFDIMSYLWAEIDVWARHLLQEVYVLARAFSWSEQEILKMSSHRRYLYLEMLRS